MKASSILALIALLGNVNASRTVRSLLERAQEEDDITSGKLDVGYVEVDEMHENDHMKKGHSHKHHSKRPHNHQHVGIEEKISSEPVVTNEARELVTDRQSADETGHDQSDRKTDTMFESDKDYEDNFYQGNHNNPTNTNTKNGVGIGDFAPLEYHTVLPSSWSKLGPTNMPPHKQKGDFKPSSVTGGSGTGVYLVYLTVDNEEHATRFIKDLFKLGLVAAVEMQEGGFDRSYLKFGRITTEKGRSRLQMTTSDSKLAELIDYINNENPTHYDYPVPNTIALPVSIANSKYAAWVKKQTTTGSGKIKYDTEQITGGGQP